MILFAILTDGILLRPQNISNLVVQNGYILVLAIGMVMVIIAGHIDLSVGSVAAFVGLLRRVRGAVGPAVVALGLLSLGIGALVGVWQGFWIAYVGIPAFIVTLAGMLIFRASPRRARQLEHRLVPGRVPRTRQRLRHRRVRRVRARSAHSRRRRARDRDPRRAAGPHASRPPEVRPGRGAHAWFVTKLVLISAAIGFFAYALASYKGIPITLIILGVLVLVYSVVMNRTVFGRHIYAIGGNRHAAELSGIKTRRVDFWLFVNMGFLAALAGSDLHGPPEPRGSEG